MITWMDAVISFFFLNKNIPDSRFIYLPVSLCVYYVRSALYKKVTHNTNTKKKNNRTKLAFPSNIFIFIDAVLVCLHHKAVEQVCVGLII